MKRPEDEAFAAFQRSRDPEALGRAFDAVATELYRVALLLTGHPESPQKRMGIARLPNEEDEGEVVEERER